MSSLIQTPEMPTVAPLSVAIISPHRQRRIAATAVLAQCSNIQAREFDKYPPSLDVVPHLLDRGFDVILIDLDGNPKFALELVETLRIARSSIVMVFSAKADPELMLRSMRAGAREFFTIPFDQVAIAKALQWVTAHPQEAPTQPKVNGRLLVFFGSKGGEGVTTVASNFAVALAEESQKSTLLIDLNLQLGDAAMNLGINAPYSTADALENSATLDSTLLSKFIVQHPSGLSILAAPAVLSSVIATNVAIGCLLAVARQRFHFVVIDAGKKVDLKQMHLFEQSSTSYLVTQVGIPELRNANRLIAQFSADNCPTLEIVVNRYQPRSLGLTDESLSKALTRPIAWKIPNDYKAVRKMQESATPIVHQDSPIAGVIRRMAKAACPQPASPEIETRPNSLKIGLRLPWKTPPKSEGAEAIKAEPKRA